jgi:uncharacterized protein
MQDATSPYSPRTNPVFWLIWLLPGAAVVAGLATLAIALRGADHRLPPTYHWEGGGLDDDVARAQNAAGLGISLTLEVRDGECVATVRNLPAATSTIELELANGANAALDRHVTLQRTRPTELRAECEPLPRGRWWIDASDAGGEWSLRTRSEGTLSRVELGAAQSLVASP